MVFFSEPRHAQILTVFSSAATNRLITAKDHASVQINIGHVDENGHIIPDQHTTYAFCGFVRARSESDDSINRLATRDGLLEGYASIVSFLWALLMCLVSGRIRDEHEYGVKVDYLWNEAMPTKFLFLSFRDIIRLNTYFVTCKSSQDVTKDCSR